ncbi:hypothetical protein [Aquimarina longa]|uniref:hypothetical protein n=1 Tax=Aquimarina longa TaxID=1080221 RepID=UPI000781CC54|nr:hypothetical protein [Aquimarina longa]
MTTLPTTRDLWSILFISGLILILYGISKQYEYKRLVEDYSTQSGILRYQLEENRNKLKFFTNESTDASKSIHEKITLNTESQNKKTEIEVEYEI